MKGKLFKKPVGASERSWNNMSMATTRAVLCELCGTELPVLSPDDESYTLMSFLGLQGVEECCGKAVDVLYDEFGERFALTYAKEFAENPSDSRFGLFLMVLGNAFQRAREVVQKTSKELAAPQSSSRAVSKAVSEES